jgi:diphthamide synthase (EF-2-diphthine--ammonia ligase)
VKARLTCVDTRKLDGSYAGREFDQQFLESLPRGIDPCGENGEFHSFVYAGPMFNSEICCEVGESVERDPFVFADLIPAEGDKEASQTRDCCVAQNAQLRAARSDPSSG